MTDEAVGEVGADVLLHGEELWSRHREDGPPRGFAAWFEVDFQVVLAMGREDVGLGL